MTHINGWGWEHPTYKTIVPFKKLQILLKSEVRGTNPSSAPSTPESAEESNAAAPDVRVTSGGRKHLGTREGLKDNQGNAECRDGKSLHE